jgi:hypothetical protein
MLSFEEARHLILSNVIPMEAEKVATIDALGRVTAEDVIAPMDLPSFDNSAMDGYAVHVSDCNRHAHLSVSGYIPAGGGDFSRRSSFRQCNAHHDWSSGPIWVRRDHAARGHGKDSVGRMSYMAPEGRTPFRPTYPPGRRGRETG